MIYFFMIERPLWRMLLISQVVGIYIKMKFKRKHDEEKFTSKGFTIKNILKDYNSIDREDIHQKIKINILI